MNEKNRSQEQQQEQKQNKNKNKTTTKTKTKTTTTTTRRRSQACPFFGLCHLSRWTSAGSPSQELPSGGSSDDCARGGDTSSSRSLRPWPRTSTTQLHGGQKTARAREEDHEMYFTAAFWEASSSPGGRFAALLPRRRRATCRQVPARPAVCRVWTAGAGSAARRGAACRQCASRADAQCYCAAEGLRGGWERARPLSTACTRASRGHPPGPCSAGPGQASDSDGGAAVVRGPREKEEPHSRWRRLDPSLGCCLGMECPWLAQGGKQILGGLRRDLVLQVMERILEQGTGDTGG